MGWLSDTFLGSRPQYQLLPGMQSYINNVQQAGQVGLGPAKYYRNAFKADAEGRIEDSPTMQAALSGIKAQGAIDTASSDSAIDRATAFEDQPFLKAALKTEAAGRIGQNQGLNWAQAGVNDAQNNLAGWEGGYQYQQNMGLQSAEAAANLYRGSIYDNRRQGGLLPQLLQSGATVGAAALS